jgi:hypothetical protein
MLKIYCYKNILQWKGYFFYIFQTNLIKNVDIKFSAHDAFLE